MYVYRRDTRKCGMYENVRTVWLCACRDVSNELSLIHI